jgi:hypothetical protein
MAIKEAIDEIRTLKSTVARLDRGNSLDVRSQLEVVDFDKIGDIIWVKVADERMLRYEVFSQIKDYLRGHGKDRAILVVTKNDVELAALTDEDLQQSGLKRMLPSDCR